MGLVVLVALALTTVAGAGTAALVGTALAWRWGTGSLAAVAGAQGVLGSGLLVGPPAGALSSMVAAIALLTATPGTGALDWASAGPALATGSAAAFVVGGMEGEPAVRVVCTVLTVAAALVVGQMPRRRERLVAAGGLAVVAALLAAVS